VTPLRFLRDVVRRWRYGEAPRFAIADLPDDTLGRIVGVVEALDDTVLEAPLSRRACVHYAVVIDEYHGPYDPHEMARNELAVPFVVRDGSDYVIVDPTHARISVRFDHITESSGMANALPYHRALLEPYHQRGERWVHGSLRYSEGVLPIGARASVFGSGMRELDPQSDQRALYRERGATRIRMMGSASTPLLISDTPRYK
jgi:E3 ubiquitin ligase